MTMAMCRLIAEEGLALDVASGGEIYGTASRFPAANVSAIIKHRKRLAGSCGVGRFVVDNSELELLEFLVRKQKNAKVYSAETRLSSPTPLHSDGQRIQNLVGTGGRAAMTA